MKEVQPPQSFAAGSVIAGKLRIVRRLGEGGMGTVFEVEHELTHHRRALKLLHAELASMPSVVERFLREASAAGRIGNPHIVETFDAGLLESGEPYIVMELLQGKSLAEVIQETGPLDVCRACDVLIQACNAVHSAHAAGIIHRDLKPENLFLSEPNCSFVKILDFGISKFDEMKTGVEGLTMEGSPIGTPYYMSPEQIRGEKDVDTRTDVYALGVVLYECLTGLRPFESDNLLQLIHLVSRGVYEAAARVRPTLPPGVDEVIAKAMALDRSHRYADANDFALVLKQLRETVGPATLEATAPAVTERPPMTVRGTLAMTPEPVSRTLGGVNASVWPHKSTLRLLVWVGASVLALIVAAVAFGPSLMRSIGGIPVAAKPGEVPASTHSTTPAAQLIDLGPPSDVTHPPVSAGSSAVELTPDTGSTSTRAHRNDASLSATKKLAPAPSAKGRADSYGLSKDNPFKP